MINQIFNDSNIKLLHCFWLLVTIFDKSNVQITGYLETMTHTRIIVYSVTQQKTNVAFQKVYFYSGYRTQRFTSAFDKCLTAKFNKIKPLFQGSPHSCAYFTMKFTQIINKIAAV